MGLVDLAQRAFEPMVVELSMKLDDKKPAAVKCRPLVTIDYFSMSTNGFSSTIPILTGQKNPDDLDAGDKIKMYMWYREIVKISVASVRDTDDDGGTIWRPVVMKDDSLEAPFVDDEGKAHLSVRILEMMNDGSVAEIATAIIERTNKSTELEVAKRGPRNR